MSGSHIMIYQLLKYSYDFLQVLTSKRHILDILGTSYNNNSAYSKFLAVSSAVQRYLERYLVSV